MINDLKAQLARCESWLLEEPDDQEVIDMAQSLRVRIESLEKAATEKVEKKDDNFIREMKSLKRKLRNLKKKLLTNPESVVILNDISEIENKIEKMKIEREVKL
jgi:hypothetical protein